jgi:hypothetical protein
MRWTRRHQLTSDVGADGEVVWSRYPDADIKLATIASAIALAMVTTSPAHQGEREISRKTIARGMPGEPV